MFDSYTIRSGPSHVTVTEKRAPTDDSVKLLREMEKAILDNVLGTVRVETNELKAVVVYALLQPMCMDKVLYVRFELNGKQYTSKYVVDDMEFKFTPETAFKKAYEAVRDEIMQQLIHPMAEALSKVPG